MRNSYIALGLAGTRKIPSTPTLPLCTGHHGTARNATGHYVVDVVERST